MSRSGEPSVSQGTAAEPRREARPATFFQGRRLSPALFGTIVLLFFFPLMFVECNSATFTGVEAATGIGFPDPDRPGEIATARDQMVPNPFASIAFSAAVAGLALGFVRRRWAARLSVALGITGFLSLSGFVMWVIGAAWPENVHPRPGVLAIPMFIVAAIANGVRSASISATSEGGTDGEQPHVSTNRVDRSPSLSRPTLAIRDVVHDQRQAEE